jgi:hypothetical protein
MLLIDSDLSISLPRVGRAAGTERVSFTPSSRGHA